MIFFFNRIRFYVRFYLEIGFKLVLLVGDFLFLLNIFKVDFILYCEWDIKIKFVNN